MENKKQKLDYMWVMMGLAFLMVATGLGLCSGGRSNYLTAICAALDLKRGSFAINDTIRYIVTTIANIYFGKTVAKFGTKKLIVTGFICLICFAFINSTATHLIGFYIASIFLGIGLCWTGTTMASTVVNLWCTKNKGTITGAVLAANGIGGAIAIQALSPIIFEEGNPFGYQRSYRIVCIILAIVLALILLFYREKEIDPGTQVGKKKKARGAGWVGMRYKDAVKKPYFYVALVCMFLIGMYLQGLGGISTPHLYDVGIPVATVATISSLASLLLTFGKFSSGFMYDRLGMRITMNICFACSFISLVSIIFVDNSKAGICLAYMRGCFSPLALPLETVMVPLFASELFGNRCFGKTVGLFAAASTAGFAVGAPLGNIIFDFFGSYNVAFALFGGIALFVAFAMQFVLSAANRDRKAILKALAEAEAKEAEEKEGPATETK